MVDCPICNSDYLEDINNMISKKAEIKYIQSWCKDRNFKLTQKEIKEHGNLHLNNLEYSPSKLSSTNSIYLTLTDIEALLSLGYEELLPYFCHRQLKVDRVKKYDVIDIMLDLIDSLNKEVARLKAKLESMTISNDLDNILELKNKKIKLKIRFQKAVASIQEIKLNQLEGKLINCEELEKQWSYSLVGFKAKLESIPNKVALELSSIGDDSEVENILHKLIEQSLEELQNGSSRTSK